MSDRAWFEQHVTLLRQLWADGHSEAEIARRINRKHGTAFTRNAVSSKVRREKLSPRMGRPR